MFASSLFAQHETENARLGELWVIVAMLKESRVNFAALLMGQFRNQAKTYSAPICIGRMVTPIAFYFGINLDIYPPQSAR